MRTAAAAAAAPVEPEEAAEEPAEEPAEEDSDATEAEPEEDAAEDDAAESDEPANDRLTARTLIARYRSKRSDEAVERNEDVKLRDVVTKVGRNEVSFGKVKCRFDEPAVDVKPGDTLSVDGTVAGRSFWTRTLTLKPCRVAD